MANRIITLTTDFGLGDPYVGVMKGVIDAIAPEARIVDLTHHIPPQDVIGGALAIEAAVPYFNEGTIHVGVIDPGVGTARRAIAIECAERFFVGPDNGLFNSAFDLLRRDHPDAPFRAREITNDSLFRRPVSATFHGRDIFAPTAAHLAAGLPLEEVGPSIEDPENALHRLSIPEPRHMSHARLIGCVIAIDRFGNLITNIRARHLPEGNRETLQARLGGVVMHGVHRTFGDVDPGEPVAYLGSSGRLEIAVRNGNAAETLDADLTAEIEVRRMDK